MSDQRKDRVPKRRAKPPTPRAARSQKPRKKQERAGVVGGVQGLLAKHRALVGLALGFALAVGLGLGALYFAAQNLATVPDAPPIVVTWTSAASAHEAAEKLAAAGLVQNETALALYLGSTGDWQRFVAGPHLLRGGSPREIAALLMRDENRPTVRVTIPEGFNRFDIAARLEKNGVAPRAAFLEATVEAALLGELGLEGAESAEGFLFPATYDLYLDADPKALVRRLVGEANRRWKSLISGQDARLDEVQRTLGWGRFELVTLASMIEKEAVVDDERPLISSVFYNRLRDPEFRPKRLQSDPTSAYGCIAEPTRAASCAQFEGKPTPAINTDADNRYSTYTRNGLPPGPIANPGEASLAAAISPASTRYFYFVAKGGSRHAFSETLGDHNSAVRKGPSAGQP